MPFLHVTTRIEGHPYDSLLSEKGGTGFPTLMFLDAEGRILETYAGPRTVKGFEDSLVGVQGFLDLVARAEGGDKSAATDVLIRQLELEWFELEEARTRVQALEKVSSKQAKVLEQLLVETEVRCVAAEAGDDPARRQAAGERFLAMWKDKRVPASEAQLYPFWFLMADHAEAIGDKKLFKKIVDEASDALKRNPRYEKVLKKLESRLETFPKK